MSAWPRSLPTPSSISLSRDTTTNNVDRVGFAADQLGGTLATQPAAVIIRGAKPSRHIRGPVMCGALLVLFSATCGEFP